MDWIEETLEKWNAKLKNISLKKAMMIYLIITVLGVLSACAATWVICDSWKMVIFQVNGIKTGYHQVSHGTVTGAFQENDRAVITTRDLAEQNLSQKDLRLWIVLSVIQTGCIPLYSLCAIFLVSAIYYKNKLKEPITLLKTEMMSIRRNDLSFSCYYDSTDEMGDICRTMDTMRKAVVGNQKNMWELMDEQRKINAAFAHDLRTPLTVISGYADMLMEHYPKGQVSEETMMGILSSIQKQAVRMQDFAETMKEIHGFESFELKPGRHTGTELENEIQHITGGLSGAGMPAIEVSFHLGDRAFFYDENIVMEVLDNLLSNALRYGRKKIQVFAERQDNMLDIYVKDDGRGMTAEELYKADSPYYSDKQNTGKHFGIGLTICKILCKKHGGGISFSNSIEGGTIVCAEFLVL